MLGAVFRQELLVAGRQDRLHQLRWAWAGLLLVQVVQYLPTLYHASRFRRPDGPLSAPAADQAFQVLAGEQLFVLLLLAPLFTAAAFTEEKARGTLLPLLATQLTPTQIVLEKFAARLAKLFLLALTGLPMLAAAAGFAQRPYLSLTAIAVATLAPVVALAAVGLLASVWCRTSSEATLATYCLLAVLFFAVPTLPILEPFNPFGLFGIPDVPADVDPAAELLRRVGWFVLGWGTVAAGCLSVAAWRLRPAYFRQLEARPSVRVPTRPPVGDDPLRWRELYAEGLLPFPLLRRLPRWTPWLFAGLGTGIAIGWGLWSRMAGRTSPHQVLAAILRMDLDWLLVQATPRFQPDWLPIGIAVAVSVAVALLANVRAATTFTAEREGQTWDTLLMLPLTGREMVEGKLRGILTPCWACLAAASVPLVIAAAITGPETLLAVLMPLALAVPFCRLMVALGLSQSLSFHKTRAAAVASLLIGLLYVLATTAVLPCCCGCQYAMIRGSGALQRLEPGRLRELASMLLYETGTLLIMTVVILLHIEECLKVAADQLDRQREYRRPPSNSR